MIEAFYTIRRFVAKLTLKAERKLYKVNFVTDTPNLNIIDLDFKLKLLNINFS